ncbi:hypothetical protein LG047_04025 [Methylocystis sp. WRRC1]|uniref:hypothetical protein n=1 Tax=Methylocystis sp. WRRC1 TaxID=1732014 RepID=UPI001D146679|nr:hypothetical protein [Methylocystis sp. WRRC1]MCC3244496.1 hypothetical protein [Methylocystis sp. WRRC1]
MTKSYFREAEALQETVGATNFSILDNDANSEDRRQFERWSGLSVALENLEERNSSARAMRIGNQILFCSRNIGWLEKIYRETIIKKFSSDSISRPEEECFSYSEDAYSSEIGYRTQSCLDSLFALRDFLFSFVFHDMYKGEKYAWNKLEKCLREDGDLHKPRFWLVEVVAYRRPSRERGLGWLISWPQAAAAALLSAPGLRPLRIFPSGRRSGACCRRDWRGRS